MTLPYSEVANGVTYTNDSRLLAFSPDGRLAAVLGQRMASNGKLFFVAGDEIDLWDLAATKRLVIFRTDLVVTFGAQSASASTAHRHDSWSSLGENPRQLVFSPNSKILAVAYNTGVVFYETTSGNPQRWLGNVVRPQPEEVQSIPTYCAAFSPDGRCLYYAGERGRINIGSIEPRAGELHTPYFSVAAQDGTWKVSQADPSLSWQGHDGTVRALAVSPDGRTLASGGDDRSIRLWEVPSGRLLAQWEAHDAGVSALAFKPDGSVLMSGATDGMAKLWDLQLIRRELSALGLDW
jgi:WD40 repeat protein